MGKARNQGGRRGRPQGDRRHHPAPGAGSAGGEPDNTFSTDTVALRLSLSRTTARRYLEFLESEDRLDVELNYGQRGRPERRYHWRRES